jgi:ABC-type Zn uptake system ZnuABC Zn-binding protein ZnuA
MFTTVVVAAAVLAACGAVGGGRPPARLRIVTTTTVIADLVGQVAGDGASVASLVPKGGEVHTFDPSPGDVAAVAEADVVFANGLGLDDWVDGLILESGTRAPVHALAEGLDDAGYLEGDGAVPNPHLWLDVLHARTFVARIATGLGESDADDVAGYEERAAAYDARLVALDSDIRERFAAIPPADRRVVSFHEAFPYFAASYGLEIVGVVVDAPGQDPSAGEIARLVEAIRASGARAVLAEAQFSADLADAVASEAGIVVVRDLYTDSLGDPPVDTYEGLMRWDADRILAALVRP